MDIRPITPALVDDYLTLFDAAFSDNPYWVGCYCAFYDDPTSNEKWDPSTTEARSRNRANRRQTIIDGRAHGLLAYESAEPIGWVNAGPRDRYGNLRYYAAAVDEGDDAVGSVMCFVVHPEHRGKQVASVLLDAVDGYFWETGLAVAEGYPRKTPPSSPDLPWTAAYYKGSPEMFEKAGYLPHKEFEHFVAVRKAL